MHSKLMFMHICDIFFYATDSRIVHVIENDEHRCPLNMLFCRLSHRQLKVIGLNYLTTNKNKNVQIG